MNYYYIFFISCYFIYAISNVKPVPKSSKRKAELQTWEEEEKLELEQIPTPTEDEFDEFIARLPPIGDEFTSDNQLKSQMIETNLGVMYLMQKFKWDCENIDKYKKVHQQLLCSKFHRYVHYIYEYFFREYAQANYSKLFVTVDLPTNVKPKFVGKWPFKFDDEENEKTWVSIKKMSIRYQWVDGEDASIRTIHDVLYILSWHYMTKFDAIGRWKPELKNEEQLKTVSDEYKEKMDKLEMENAKNPKIFENLTQKIGSKMEQDLRDNFDKLLKKMAKKAKKLAEDTIWKEQERILKSPFLEKI